MVLAMGLEHIGDDALAARAVRTVRLWPDDGRQGKADLVTAAGQGLGDGAPPVRDDRTWTLKRFKAVASGRTQAIGPLVDFEEAVEVVPRSELLRVEAQAVTEAHDAAMARDHRDAAERELVRVQGELDQAREALKEYAQHTSWRCGHPDRYLWDPDCPCLLTKELRDLGVTGVYVESVAASGVTEKGDGNDG